MRAMAPQLLQLQQRLLEGIQTLCGSAECRVRTGAARALSPRKVQEEDDMCAICFSSRINTVILPCGHFAICADCGG